MALAAPVPTGLPTWNHSKTEALAGYMCHSKSVLLSMYEFSPANMSECKVSLSPYHERSPNSEAEFLASFWPKGGAGWNALRALRAILRSGSHAHRKRLRQSRKPVAHTRDGVSGVRKTERDKILTRRLFRTGLARFQCLRSFSFHLALAFAGQD